jgi:hypothetical protein
MLSDVDTKRFTLSVIVLFVFTHLFGVLGHGPLETMFSSAPSLVADGGDMVMVGVKELLLAFIIAYLFTRNYEGKGTGEGVRFGLLIGLLISIVLIGGMVDVTISGVLTLVIITVIYGIISGVLLSLTYKK